MGVKLIDRTAEVRRQIPAQLAIRLNNAAQFFVKEAKQNANVDTGFMKAHIGQTVQATASSLSAEMRSLAKYSYWQDAGRRGNLFFSKAYLATRERFKVILSGGIQVGTAGGDVIRAAEQEFHGPLGRKGGGF